MLDGLLVSHVDAAVNGFIDDETQWKVGTDLFSTSRCLKSSLLCIGVLYIIRIQPKIQ